MKAIKQKHEIGGNSGCFKFFKYGFYAFIGIHLIGVPLMLLYDFFTQWRFKSLVGFIIVAGVYYLVYNFITRKGSLGRFKGLFGGLGVNSHNNNETSRDTLKINNTVQIGNPFAGVFICGGAGSGKSKSIIEPIIKEIGNKQYTGVVYDFKYPELANYVATSYKNSNVKTYFVDFMNVSKSNRINPIAPDIINTTIKAQELAYSVMVNLDDSLKSNKGDSFFSQSAVGLLGACMWYLKINFPEYCTLPHAISMIVFPNSEKLIKTLASNHTTAEMISPILSAYTQGADKQLAGQLSSAQLPLQKLNTPEIFWILSESDFDLNLNNPLNKGILTIGNNPSIQDSLSPIIALIMTSTMKLLNQPNKENSVFLVDEFPTLYIPKVEQLPATARSNKVATVLACQDIAQIVDGYGKEKADTILSNLGNQFYGRTTNITTAERVSKIFGKYDKRKQSVSRKGLKGVLVNTKTESTQETDLVKPTEVMQTNTGSFYTLLSSGKQRLGLSSIPIDERFVKSEIPINKNVTDSDIVSNFDKIKDDIKEVVFYSS